jgi:hypothetical protein
MLIGNGYGAIARKGWLSCHHFVQHHTERINVAPGIDRLALSLFGGKVRGRAHDRTGLGQPFAGVAYGPGDAEIGDFYLSGAVN